ncbi:MAG: protein kinase [Alphaproteobacteria bacterium]|nr:protein kinase [Alphaproteobacteria bacterium]
MGEVYEATDGSSNDVVIKFPITKFKDGRPVPADYYMQIVEKLKVEARILGSFAASNPPSIVKYVDEASDQDDFFLVIERIRGRTLTKEVPSGGLPEEDVIRHALEILEGLEFIHRRNTLYRDMKSDNVMLDDGGRCVMIDFGTARQGMTQASMGPDIQNATQIYTEAWSCPDQKIGKASAECDLYALGKVVHFMATGINPRTIIDRRLEGKRLHEFKPKISRELSDLVDGMIDPLHKSAHTAHEIAARFRAIQTGAAPSQTPPRVAQIHVAPAAAGRSVRHGPRAGHLRGTYPRIVLQGTEYRIPVRRPGGTIIGKGHNVRTCIRNRGGCNHRNRGTNIFVGWRCPRGCMCDTNPAHVIDRHHMRVWKNRSGDICAMNMDPERRSAMNRNGTWIPMTTNLEVVLKDRDQVALLYNEQKGPYISFTFYT